MSKIGLAGKHRHLVAVLVEARHSSGLTQTQVAARVGMDQAIISNIERGLRRVDVLEFAALSQAMGVNPSQLLADVVKRIAPRGRPQD